VRRCAHRRLISKDNQVIFLGDRGAYTNHAGFLFRLDPGGTSLRLGAWQEHGIFVKPLWCG